MQRPRAVQTGYKQPLAHSELFEDLLDERGDIALKANVARYLYLGGIRGSLYSAFLCRFFESAARNELDGLALAVDKDKDCPGKTVSYIFETMCRVSDETQQQGSESYESPCTSDKRKISCLEEPGKEHKRVLNDIARLSKVYMDGRVPRDSYGWFLRLNSAGRHFFMRIKRGVIEDEGERLRKMIFMALCGTDHNIVPMGLGIKRLMTGVVTNRKLCR